ncbi:MAG: glycosyltransferase family 4 protein [Lentisphaerota bacterium]
MRLFGLVPFKILPAHSGGQALTAGAYTQFAKLAKSFSAVSFITLRDSKHGSCDLFDLEEWKTPASLLIGLERVGCSKMAYFQALDLYAQALARMILRQGSQVVEVTMPWLMGVRRHLPAHVKVVLLMQNVEAMWYEETLDATILPGLFKKWVSRLERRGLECADHVVVLTGADRENIMSRYGVSGKKISVIPPGCDEFNMSATAEPARSGVRKKAVFVGSRFSGNRVASRILIEQIAPACKDFADVVLAGAICDDWANAALPCNVKLAGFRPDLRAFFRGCDLFLNPNTMKTGINIKMMDALSCGLPVLSTREGARGFEPLVGGAITTAEPRDFPELIRKSRPLSAAEREPLAGYFWPRIAQRRLDLYQTVLEGSS